MDGIFSTTFNRKTVSYSLQRFDVFKYTFKIVYTHAEKIVFMMYLILTSLNSDKFRLISILNQNLHYFKVA